MPLSSTTWTIAEIANEFSVTHRALRHYEQMGLLSPERVGPNGSRRLYDKRDHIRLALILRGRRLGFPLEEIGTIIDMYDDQPGEAGQLRYLLDQIQDRRADLQRRRADIDQSLGELDELETRCHSDLDKLS